MSSTIAKEIQEMQRVSEAMLKSFKNNPAKAKKWLIQVGILTKDGKKLAPPYR